MSFASYWKAGRRLNHGVHEACDLNCFLTCQAVLVKTSASLQKGAVSRKAVFQEALTDSFTLDLL